MEEGTEMLGGEANGQTDWHCQYSTEKEEVYTIRGKCREASADRQSGEGQEA